jgi:hypothetical protein
MTRLYKLRTLALCVVVALSESVSCGAQNPIIQTNFTADPAPLVYNGTVYLYTSHDEEDATGFHMLNWKLYTSTDMVNWTDHKRLEWRIDRIAPGQRRRTEDRLIACFLHGRMEQMEDEDNDRLWGHRCTRPLLSIPRRRYGTAL